MDTTASPSQEHEKRLVAIHNASLGLIQVTSLVSLLERIAATASEQLGSHHAAVGILDEDGKLHGFFSTAITTDEVKKGALDAIDGLFKSPEPLHKEDVESDLYNIIFPGVHPEVISFLGVPLHKNDDILGQIFVANKQDATRFSLEDQEVLEILAEYVAFSISNTLMYGGIRESDSLLVQRSKNQALLNNLSSILSLDLSSDTTQILEKAMTQIMESMHIEVGEIYLYEEGTNILKLTLHRGTMINHLWTKTQFQTGELSVGQAAQEDKTISIGNPDKSVLDIHHAVIDGPLREIVCIPMTGQSNAQGVLCVATDHEQSFSDLEIQLLSTICSWLGTAIENIRLNLQQRRMAVLEERARIGMDLHDGTIQSIYGVGLTLEHSLLLIEDDVDQAVNKIHQAIDGLNATIRDLRSYILDLQLHQLYDDISRGVRRLVNEFHANTQVEIELQSESDGLEKLPGDLATILFHICQEALANVAKHAQAKRVEVVMWTASDRALLEISDDGIGFDREEVKFSLGHGLSNIQFRARAVGGDVEISSEPGKGSTILAWVPFSSDR